jgi:hypothetical protein
MKLYEKKDPKNDPKYTKKNNPMSWPVCSIEYCKVNQMNL